MRPITQALDPKVSLGVAGRKRGRCCRGFWPAGPVPDVVRFAEPDRELGPGGLATGVIDRCSEGFGRQDEPLDHLRARCRRPPAGRHRSGNQHGSLRVRPCRQYHVHRPSSIFKPFGVANLSRCWPAWHLGQHLGDGVRHHTCERRGSLWERSGGGDFRLLRYLGCPSAPWRTCRQRHRYGWLP